MIKTGYEIVGMIKDGYPPKKIKDLRFNTEYDFVVERCSYENEKEYLRMTARLDAEFEIIDAPEYKKFIKGDFYAYITEYSHVFNTYWNNRWEDLDRYEIGDCFETEQEAEKYLEKIKIYTQLKRYAEEHNVEKIDWENVNQVKWFIRYDFFSKKLVGTDLNVIKDIGQIYFTSDKLCKQAIQEIGEDKIKKLFEE